jgi:tetratricopeptide (TPR) repeat protein
MKVMLRLIYDDAQHRPAGAWFVVGAAAHEWLAELSAWQSPLAAARLYIVPTSPADRRPCGVFVVGAAPHDGRPSPRSLPYAAIDRRLFVPGESRLDPEPTAAELAELLGEDLHLWHPQAGLLALPANAGLRVSDLLAAPVPSTDVWTAAVPGIALNGKLVSIEPEIVPTAQDVLNDARGDIGSQPLQRSQLPPTPDEPREGLAGDTARAIGKGIAKLAQWIAKQASSVGGAGSGEPAASSGASRAAGDSAGSGWGWVKALESWAGKRLERISQALETARNRELHRLMKLLEKNPDEGLRYALPMGSGEHRGLAPPSSTLGPRDVNFSLGGLGGGRAADFWDVPAEMQRRLFERYRELAAREIALGRHRRAAYIFASLLGDLRSAASTLADGGHYREAAMLYEEKLHQPESAADCLRKGHCWNEAIAIYDRLGRHETVGDIYVELEQVDDAEAAYRRAVEQKLTANDVLGAAKLLEGKLANPDEAYEKLTAAWPTSKQAQTCLLEAFALSARHGRHEQAAALVAAAAEKYRPLDATAPLVDVLARQACDYPDAAVRERAADRTRTVVADRLGARLEETEVARLVAAVGRLVPNDRLLARDGHRYTAEHRRRQVQPHGPSFHLQCARELRLPSLDWRAATATDEAIFLAGFRGCELVVLRTDWRGAEPDEPIGAKWDIHPGHVENPILLAADPTGNESLLVHVIGAPVLPHLRWFKVSDRFSTPMGAGPHSGVSGLTYAACRSGRETLHVIDFGEDASLVAHAYLSRAQLGGVSSIDLLKLKAVQGEVRYPLPVAMRDETLCVGIGQSLCSAHLRHGLKTLETPHSITQLVASPPHTRSRLAVAMQQGGLLLWGDDPRAPRAPFASEMDRPQIALTRDGTLVAASAEEVDLYATGEGRLRLRGRTRGPGLPPVAVVAARRQNSFAMLLGDGRLMFYELAS